MTGCGAAIFLMWRNGNVLSVPCKDVLSLKTNKQNCFPVNGFLKILSSSGCCDAVCTRTRHLLSSILSPELALLPHLWSQRGSFNHHQNKV